MTIASTRVGFGFDVHRLNAERPLRLGGVTVPHSAGLEGHSDADVLLHAITDALLGAAALGDIGAHFPDTEAAWEGADSRDLLKRAVVLLADRGYRVVNVDSTVAAQAPKLQGYVPEMIRVIAQILDVSEDAVSVKATTTERLGFVGREEGISAYAVCLIERT